MLGSDFQFAAIPLQGAAGQSTAVAAQGAGLSIYVWGFGLTVDANGTAKWQSNNTDLTGAMTVTTTSGLAAVPGAAPIVKTAQNEALKFTTATGKGAGYVVYSVGP